MSAASENSNDDVDINRAWETITENIKTSAKAGIGYYEMQECFDKA
jgi:hypothetical protein